MIRRFEHPLRWAGALAVGALLLVASVATTEAADPNPESARRGRTIYRSGEGAKGPILGRIGAGGVELRGELVACGGCHGLRGEGSFGGEAAPPLRADKLFQPAAADPSGRGARPAYDREVLRRAVVEGIGASGRPLSNLMPRFELDDRDFADLAAWLQVLGTAPEAGVEQERIVLGTVLPRSGPLAAAGADVEATLRAAFADLAAAGGIYGRRLELVVEDGAQAGAVERLIERPVFALVGNVRNGARPTDRRLEKEKLPLVGPIGFAGPASEAAPTIFWLYPGPAQQARWAVQQLDVEGPIVVVADDDEASRQWAEAALDEARRLALDARRADAASASLAHAAAVLYAGEPAGLLALAESLPASVELVAPGSLAQPSLGENEAARRVRFVYPAPLEPAGEAFAAFARRHGLPDRNHSFQATAWASAQLLIEALRRTGAEPTRERLLDALETIRDFETGVTPPLTFGPWRRLGVGGARFVNVGAGGELRAASQWQALAGP